MSSLGTFRGSSNLTTGSTSGTGSAVPAAQIVGFRSFSDMQEEARSPAQRRQRRLGCDVARRQQAPLRRRARRRERLEAALSVRHRADTEGLRTPLSDSEFRRSWESKHGHGGLRAHLHRVGFHSHDSGSGHHHGPGGDPEDPGPDRRAGCRSGEFIRCAGGRTRRGLRGTSRHRASPDCPWRVVAPAGSGGGRPAHGVAWTARRSLRGHTLLASSPAMG